MRIAARYLDPPPVIPSSRHFFSVAHPQTHPPANRSRTPKDRPRAQMASKQVLPGAARRISRSVRDQSLRELSQDECQARRGSRRPAVSKLTTSDSQRSARPSMGLEYLGWFLNCGRVRRRECESAAARKNQSGGTVIFSNQRNYPSRRLECASWLWHVGSSMDLLTQRSEARDPRLDRRR
jgi:hypothetical protein